MAHTDQKDRQVLAIIILLIIAMSGMAVVSMAGYRGEEGIDL